MSDEELKQLALQGYFVRDADKYLVYCPQGSILRQKSLKKDGRIRYCNKLLAKNARISLLKLHLKKQTLTRILS